MKAILALVDCYKTVFFLFHKKNINCQLKVVLKEISLCPHERKH